MALSTDRSGPDSTRSALSESGIGLASEPVSSPFRGQGGSPCGSPFDQALAVLAKDLRSELRNRAAINSILLFSLTTLVVVGFAVGSTKTDATLQAALIWVVLFFAAFSGLAHVFLHEEDAGTTTALRLSASPGAVYTGKLLFNLILLGTIMLVVCPLFMLMLSIRPERPAAFAVMLLAGGLGLGASATIVAAIIAKARGKGALYGALGFPLLLPLLFIALDGTKNTLLRFGDTGAIGRDLIGLLAFAAMEITASALLFPFVWED